MIKRIFYLIAFSIFGGLLAALFYALLEMTMINLLTADFRAWSLGLSWDDWFTIGQIGPVVLVLLGLTLGYRWGRFWWHTLYKPNGTLRHRRFVRWQDDGRDYA